MQGEWTIILDGRCQKNEGEEDQKIPVGFLEFDLNLEGDQKRQG